MRKDQSRIKVISLDGESWVKVKCDGGYEYLKGAELHHLRDELKFPPQSTQHNLKNKNPQGSGSGLTKKDYEKCCEVN